MKKLMMLLAAALLPLSAIAGTIPMYLVNKDGTGQVIGNIKISMGGRGGLVFTPALQHLTPGLHGIHIHENPTCDAQVKEGVLVPGLAAGSHYDPYHAKEHGTPWGPGHAGDLPALYVDEKGYAQQPFYAPRLTIGDVKGRSIVIHANGDNYSDVPNKFGGGGARVACGVIPE